jgi:hypothetical protein
MTTAHAGRWRRERRAQWPTLNVSGGRGAVATEVLRSNRPLPQPGRLLEPGAVGCP